MSGGTGKGRGKKGRRAQVKEKETPRLLRLHEAIRVKRFAPTGWGAIRTKAVTPATPP